MSGRGPSNKNKNQNKSRGGCGGHDRPAPMRRDAPVTVTVQASSRASTDTHKASNRKNNDHISAGSAPSVTVSNQKNPSNTLGEPDDDINRILNLVSTTNPVQFV